MPNPSETPDKKWSGEVDRLLRQLGPATPVPARAAAKAARSTKLPRPASARGPAKPPRPLPTAPPRVATLPTPYGVWARVALAAILFGAMTQWPYARCGFALLAYLAGVLVVLVAGGWAGYAAWRRRMGRAHAIAIALLFAGLALGALQVLPRVGYAPVDTPWGCAG